MDTGHRRGRWARIGSSFYGGEYSLGCVCGWRSDWTRLHYKAEMALKEHLESAPAVASSVLNGE